MAAQPIPYCRSWRCWIQDNFTAVALLGLLVLSMACVVLLMHEEKIDDKYVTWFEGFAAGVFSTFTLALKVASSGQHQGDTIRTGDNAVVNQSPTPAIVLPVADPLENPATTPVTEPPRPDLPVFAERS